MLALLHGCGAGAVEVTGLAEFGPVESVLWVEGGVADALVLDERGGGSFESVEIAAALQLYGSPFTCGDHARVLAAWSDASEAFLADFRDGDACTLVPAFLDAWADAVAGVPSPAHRLAIHPCSTSDCDDTLDETGWFNASAQLTYGPESSESAALRARADAWDAAACALGEVEGEQTTSFEKTILLTVRDAVTREHADGTFRTKKTVRSPTIEGRFAGEFCEFPAVDRLVFPP